MLADCLHDLTALGVDGVLALMAALFLAGLAGGFTHCAGMCAPFVLAQASATADRHLGGGSMRRLAGAALLPYQAGRTLGYASLGAVAGAAAGLVSRGTGLRWVLAALLLGAAILMAAQASRRLGAVLPRLGSAPSLPGFLTRPIGALLASPTGWRGVGLGLLLSGLPCGLLYGALAAASASGSALGGALGMAAFALGTVPALTGVALLGALFGRRNGHAVRAASGALFALNAVVLVVVAARTAFA